ncbi:MAG TPA: AMP-binding protein [Verrucomicrobiae bacterium]|nr:AMP-binding protein [Verrucomicrobiae bacterium]
MSLEDKLYPLLAVYERMPRPLKRTLGAAYRRLPQKVRLGAAYGDFRKLIEESQSWSKVQMTAWQVEQLRTVLHEAVNYCPFYRKRSARVDSFDDLAAWPTLEKKDLQEHREQLKSTRFSASQRLYITTGGSTGEPVGFYLQRGVSRPKEQAFLEAMWRRAGYTDGARMAVIRGHVTTSAAHGRIVSYDATRDWLMLSSFHLTADRLPEYLEAIENFKPDMLHVYPSAALQLAEFLEQANQSWRIPLRAVLCGSEQLTLPQKRVVERVFGCRVYRWYGHSERVVLAGEAQDSDLFHFWPQYGFVEFGPPEEDGLREVIGTSFHNLAMPLIRYRTGDYVRVNDSGAVSEIAGRAQEFLLSATGRRISLTAFNMHDAIFDNLYAVQFYQETPGEAEFRYIPAPHFNRTRLEAIEKRMRQKLGDDFRIELRAVKEVEKTARGKQRWLVSKLH